MLPTLESLDSQVGPLPFDHFDLRRQRFSKADLRKCPTDRPTDMVMPQMTSPCESTIRSVSGEALDESQLDDVVDGT